MSAQVLMSALASLKWLKLKIVQTLFTKGMAFDTLFIPRNLVFLMIFHILQGSMDSCIEHEEQERSLFPRRIVEVESEEQGLI